MIFRIAAVLWTFYSAGVVGATVKVDTPPPDLDQHKRQILLSPCDTTLESCVPFSNPVSFAENTSLIAAYKLTSPTSVLSLTLALTDLNGLDIVTLVSKTFNPPMTLMAGINTLEFVSQQCTQCILKLTLHLKNGSEQSFGTSVRFGDDSGTLIGSGADGTSSQHLGDSFPLTASGESGSNCGLVQERSEPDSMSGWYILALLAVLFGIRLRRSA